MKKRLVKQLLQKHVSGLIVHEDYFFRSDFDHILRGAVIEYVPRGLYINDFRFPLFDPAGPNLLYSDRTPGSGFVGKADLTEPELVEYLLSVPELQTSLVTAPPTSLEDFVSYLPSLKNAHARLAHGAALILMHQIEAAIEVLDAVRTQLHPSDEESFRRLRSSLEHSPEGAMEYLGHVRTENLRALGCPA
jgi:hypothetical protein